MARMARERREVCERWRRELWQMFADGTLRPVVHGEFTLEDASKAHEAIEARNTPGTAALNSLGRPLPAAPARPRPMDPAPHTH